MTNAEIDSLIEEIKKMRKPRYWNNWYKERQIGFILSKRLVIELLKRRKSTNSAWGREIDVL